MYSQQGANSCSPGKKGFLFALMWLGLAVTSSRVASCDLVLLNQGHPMNLPLNVKRRLHHFVEGTEHRKLQQIDICHS